MIHIVFEKASVDVLQKTIELDASLAGEIIEIKKITSLQFSGTDTTGHCFHVIIYSYE